MKIRLNNFGGIAPILDAEALPDHMAQTAQDCRLSSGKLVPLRQNRVVSELGATGHKSLYRWTYTLHRLVCGEAGSTTVASWVALTKPGFTITIDDEDFEILPDFSGATTMADIATDLQEAIREETEGIERVEWSTDHFVIHTDSEVEVLTPPEVFSAGDDTDPDDDLDREVRYDISGSGWLNGDSSGGTAVEDEQESWLTWEDDANVVRSPVADDRFNRIYWTGGGGKPQVKGTAAGELRQYDLKIPAPERPPLLQTELQFEFTQWTAYIEKASDGTVVGTVTMELDDGVDRDGSLYSFTARFDQYSFLIDTEYRIVVMGYLGNAPVPYWVTAKTVFSFLWNGRLNTAYYHYWTESLWNGKHHDEIVADPENGVEYSAATDRILAENDSDENPSLATANLTLRYISNVMNSDVVDYTLHSEETGQIYAMKATFRPKLVMQVDGTYPACPETTAQRFCYAYVSEWGEEGPASEPSDEIEREPGDNVRVWMPTTAWEEDAANRGIVKRRIYQTDGNGDLRFCFDVDLDIEDTDNVANATLGTKLKADGRTGTLSRDNGVLEWDYHVAKTPLEELGEVLEDGATAPDDELAGLVEIPGGYLAGFKGREVWYCLANRPEAWPEVYRFMVHDEIVAIAPSGNELFVLTTRKPWLLTGSEPTYITQTLIQHDDACIAKRGVAQVRNLVLSPGPDGLSAFLGGGADMATEAVYRSQQWLALGPELFVAAAQDGMYLAFNTNGGLLFDPKGNLLPTTSSDTGITALFRDDAEDAMYAIDGGNLVVFDSPDEDCRTFTWRSKEFVVDKPVRWVSAKVRAESYEGSIVLNLYGDGELRASYTPSSVRSTKIAIAKACRRWVLEVEADVPVYEIAVGTSISELGG